MCISKSLLPTLVGIYAVFFLTGCLVIDVNDGNDADFHDSTAEASFFF